MTCTESRATKPRTSWFSKAFVWLMAVIGFLCRVLLLAWATLAIYYSNLPWAWLRLVAGGGVFGFRYLGLVADAQTANALGFCRIVSLRARLVDLYPPFPRSSMAARGVGDAPGNHRRRPRAHHRFSQFRIPQPDDFTVRYEERESLISHLTSLDFFVSYWKQGPVGHTFVSFNFDNALPSAYPSKQGRRSAKASTQSPRFSSNSS